MNRKLDQAETPKRTRQPQPLLPGAAADRITALRAAHEADVANECAALKQRLAERLAEREAAILQRCVDAERAIQILNLNND